MPPNLLVLPLLGGYCFVHLVHFLRFRAQRLEGYRLLMESAIAGVLLLLLSRAIVLALIMYGQAHWQNSWFSFWSMEYSGTASGAFLLGITIPVGINLLYSKRRAKSRALSGHGNAVYRLLHQAETNRSLIAVTMDNRKWYVGMVADSPSLDPQEVHFRLLPVLSGYRKPETLEVSVTVHYRFAETTTTSDVVVTLPLADIKSATLFDEYLFFKVFNKQQVPPETVTVEADPAADLSP